MTEIPKGRLEAAMQVLASATKTPAAPAMNVTIKGSGNVVATGAVHVQWVPPAAKPGRKR